jgi:hypothetical protein
MTKKRGKKVFRKSKKSILPTVVNAEKAVAGKIGSIERQVAEDVEKGASFFSRFLKKYVKQKSGWRKKEEKDLKNVEWGVNDLVVERKMEKTSKNVTPTWFYIASLFAVYLFTIYISIYAAIHFENIEYMNMTVVFLFITMVSYFLISAIYFTSEKKIGHSTASTLFFVGLVAVMVYAFKAADTSNLVRFAVIYAIIVAGISTYVLTIRR